MDDCSNIFEKTAEQEKDAPMEIKTSIDRNICKVCTSSAFTEINELFNLHNLSIVIHELTVILFL